MMEVISIIYIVSALLVIAALYLLTLVGIWGNGSTERYPYLGLLSVILSYLIYILSRGLIDDKLAAIVWIITSTIPSLLILISMIVGKRGNLLVDLASFIVVLIIGFIPLFSSGNYDINTQLAHLMTEPVNLDVIVSFMSLLILLSATLYILPTYIRKTSSFSRIDRDLALRIEEMNRQQNTYMAFMDPLSKMLSDELHSELSRIRSELKTEIARNRYLGQGSSKISKKSGGDIMMEVRKMNSMLRNLQTPRKDFTMEDFMKDVKHSLATPLSQIETNCALLEAFTDADDKSECVNKIRDIVKVCQNIIASYQEIVNVPAIDESQPLSECIDELMSSLEKKVKRRRITLEKLSVPDSLPGYSNSVISSMMLPLLQNAVAASPEGGAIIVEITDDETTYVISLTNQCEGYVPTSEQLKTSQYSSKKNHLGVGLSTVRNYLRLLKECSLDFNIEDKKVTVKITLKKR